MGYRPVNRDERRLALALVLMLAGISEASPSPEDCPAPFVVVLPSGSVYASALEIDATGRAPRAVTVTPALSCLHTDGFEG
jgi:hypothetical protein